jgi:hypothetical protein
LGKDTSGHIGTTSSRLESYRGYKRSFCWALSHGNSQRRGQSPGLSQVLQPNLGIPAEDEGLTCSPAGTDLGGCVLANALATADMPVSPHTASGEILTIVDSGTSKYILQCRTLLANCKGAHVVCPVLPEIPDDTSRSTYSGDLLCAVRTEDGQFLPLSDTSSALVVPNAKRPPWSVRHVQLAVHEIVLGAKPGDLLQWNPRYFVHFINCPETSDLFADGFLHLKIRGFKITNAWDIFHSSACVSSALTVLHHLRPYV